MNSKSSPAIAMAKGIVALLVLIGMWGTAPAMAQVAKAWWAYYQIACCPDEGPRSEPAMAVDAAGNVYLTGASWWDRDKDEGFGEEDGVYTTVKYDANGHELWVARYDGPGDRPDNGNSIVYDIGWALAVDKVGNVYVTGHSQGVGTGSDYTTIKYGPAGKQQWVARYNGPGNGDDTAAALAMDEASNIYVTGYSQGVGSGRDYTTIKYDRAGKPQWVARYNGPGNGDDTAAPLAVDKAGNVYVTGSSQGIGTGRDYATSSIARPVSDSGWPAITGQATVMILHRHWQ